jgi:acyl dehydratase
LSFRVATLTLIASRLRESRVGSIVSNCRDLCYIESDMDFSNLKGRIFSRREPITITAERIAIFCAAVGETNPLYVDPMAAAAGPFGGLIAPPALVASFRYADDVFEQIPVFRRGGLMGGIDIEFEAPIRPGDSIEVASEVQDIYEKTGRTGTMIFVVVRSTLTNQRGEVVARVNHRMMNRPNR